MKYFACLQLTLMPVTCGLMALACSAIYPAHATTFSGKIVVVQSTDDQLNGAFTDKLHEFISQPNSLNKISVVTANRLTTTLAREADIIVGIGLNAAKAISALDNNKPTIYTLLPQEAYDAETIKGNIRCPTSRCRAVFINQPISRQLKLIRSAFPNYTDLLLLTSPGTTENNRTIANLSSRFGLKSTEVHVDSELTLIKQLQPNIPDKGVLLINPDPLIYTRNTARSILLLSYKSNMPTVAYSQAFVDAGATIGLFSTPEQIAQQTSELIKLPLTTNNDASGIYPKYFTISINKPVLESLGITLPSIEYLHQQLNSEK